MFRKITSTILLALAIVFLGSCDAQRKSTQGGEAGPSASQWRSAVKGAWVLESVTREDIPQAYTIKNIFDEAPVDCFLRSVWELPGGNHKGSINFTADGNLCAPGASRAIVWSIYNPKNSYEQPQFQFKKIYAGEKPSQVDSGYRMKLSYADESRLELRLPIALDEGEGHLVFKFRKQ
ncbi:MAG TPA: hypothetical protein H9853_03260 [Candidatus Sphingobacterium stercoripullorum]|uniref:Lipocalin-like domain-containing protein n=1 Tax=Candidatus Sphingobacterium stercoripullorum TaxID=2838759 RepID=A0A9D1W7G3_9SPHI|nr:hypothetical protein [Candidatus Sphingobacterium stercoripullorum]